MAARVTVAICTRDRPDELWDCVGSLGRLRYRRVGRPDVDVVVVENGPDRSGCTTEELSALCGLPVRLVHEPRPGVAFARNTAVAHRRRDADWFVFVDDDETVTPSWLDHHLAYATGHDADVFTGPVLVRIPPEAGPMATVMWQNIPRYETGSVRRSFLGGNVCFRASLFDETDLRYDERFALSTADDADLGRRLTRAGYRIVWNDRAVAWESVHAARLRTAWFVRRYLSYGGFESISRRRDDGWRGLVGDAPGEALRLVRGVAHGLRGVTGDPAQRAAAIAEVSQASGWFLGVGGWRISDYRRVTSHADPGRSGVRQATQASGSERL